MTPPSTPPNRARDLSRRNLVFAAIGTSLVVVLALGGIWLAWPRKEPAVPAAPAASDAPPPPPEVDLSELDPAIGAQIRAARSEVEKAPQNAESWGQLGSMLMVNRFHAEAIKCFVVAEILAPNDARWPYLQGFVALPYDASAALPKLRRGADLSDDTNIAPRIRVMHLLLDRGDIDEAEPYIRSVLSSHPGEPRALLAQGKLNFARGNLQEALSALEKSAASPQTAKASLLLIATIQQRNGNTTAAAETAAKAEGLPQDPNQDDPWVLEIKRLAVGEEAALEQADRMLKANSVGPAVKLLNQIVEGHPESSPAWQSLGWARLRAHDFFGAQQALKKAIELAPGVSESHFQLGNAYFLGALYRPAAEAFRESIALRPDYAPGHHNLGLCLESLNDAPGAIAEFQEAVRLDPNFADAYQRLGARLALEGRFAEALDPLNHALSLDPGNTGIEQMIERAKLRISEQEKPESAENR